MPNSYSGGIAMISVDDAEEIAQACMLAGRPDRIAEFLGSRLTPGEVMERLTTAAAPAAAAAASPSIFGGPSPAERDPLAAAIEKRLKAMYPTASKGG